MLVKRFSRIIVINETFYFIPKDLPIESSSSFIVTKSCFFSNTLRLGLTDLEEDETETNEKANENDEPK